MAPVLRGAPPFRGTPVGSMGEEACDSKKPRSSTSCNTRTWSLPPEPRTASANPAPLGRGHGDTAHRALDRFASATPRRMARGTRHVQVLSFLVATGDKAWRLMEPAAQPEICIRCAKKGDERLCHAKLGCVWGEVAAISKHPVSSKPWESRARPTMGERPPVQPTFRRCATPKECSATREAVRLRQTPTVK